MSSALQEPATSPEPATEPAGVSRRGVLATAGLAAMAVGASSVIGASPASAAAAPAASSGAAAFLTNSAERHLLNRATYGANAVSLAEIHKMGTTKWLEWQLNPTAIKDHTADSLLLRLPVPSDATPIWRVNYLIDKQAISGWDQMMSVPTGHMIRAIWGRRQLQTMLEEFWGDLFNVTVPHDNIAESRAHYQYTIRTHSMGRFADLLWGISSHPSMLTYLNNRDSTADAPNENQGRELLELHSVGVDAGYTEADVLTSARILTGLSVNSDSSEYEFRPWQHWVGPIKVFGFRDANKTQLGGEAVAKRWINYLAHHPATAKRISRRLLQRFVTDNPSSAQIAALAKTYLAHDTNIKPMLRQIFHSTSFAKSQGQKIRRPIEHVASTVRLLESQPELEKLDAVDALVYMVSIMGQQPFGWPMPNGYPEPGASWLSTATTLNRWNTTVTLANHWYPTALRTPKLVQTLFGAHIPKTHGALIDTAAVRLFGRKVSANHKAAILVFLKKNASDPVVTTAGSESGAISWQLGNWVALLLDSPYHLYR